MAKHESTAINALIHDLQAKRVDRASARNLFAVENEVPEVPFVPQARQQATLQQPFPQIPSIAQPAANKIRYAADSTPVRTARGTDAPPLAQQLPRDPAQSRSAQHRAQPAHTPRPQQPEHRRTEAHDEQSEHSLHIEPQYAQQARSQYAAQARAQQARRDQPRPRPMFADKETVVAPQPELQRAEIAHARKQRRPKFVPHVATVLERLGPVAETPDPDADGIPDFEGMQTIQPAPPVLDGMPMVQSALPEHDDEETEMWAAPPRPAVGSATPAQVAAAARIDALSRGQGVAFVAAAMPVAPPDARARSAARSIALPLAPGERTEDRDLDELAATAQTPSRSAGHAADDLASPGVGADRSARGAASRSGAYAAVAARSGVHVAAQVARSGAYAAVAARSGAYAAAQDSGAFVVAPADARGPRSAARAAASPIPRDSQANAALARYLEASRRMSPGARQPTSRELVSTTVRYAAFAAVALIAIGIGVYLAVFSAAGDLEPDKAVWIDVGASAPKPPVMTVVKAPPPREAADEPSVTPIAEPPTPTSEPAKTELAAEPAKADSKAEPSTDPKAEPTPKVDSKLDAKPAKTTDTKAEPKFVRSIEADDTAIDESDIELEPNVAKRHHSSSHRAAPGPTATAKADKPVSADKPERKLTKAELDDPVLAVVRSKPKADAKPTGPATEIAPAKGAAPTKGNGKVTIASNVAATIFVDGRPTGKSAPAALVLPAGDHSITLLDPATKKAKTASIKVDPAQAASIRKDFN